MQPLGTAGGAREALPSSGLLWGRTIALQSQRSLHKPWFLPLAFHFNCLSFPVSNGFFHSKASSSKVHKPFLPGTGSVIPDQVTPWSEGFTSWKGLLQEGEMILLLGLQSPSSEENFVLVQLVWSNLGFTYIVKEKPLLKDKWVHGEM